MEHFKQKKNGENNVNNFTKDPAEEGIFYNFIHLINIIEENRGIVDKKERTADGVVFEKALNTFVDKGVRWCVRNFYKGWSVELQIIRKKILEKREKINVEEMALLKTINAVLNPHKVNEAFVRNHYLEPREIYSFYLNDLKSKKPNW
ncbi:MAG: hypothetical protein NZ903_02240 [Candidatus Micrarchaeota archaeon]|nr:hypothetical protein [Candidatus Micrarchaeota archaeon]